MAATAPFFDVTESAVRNDTRSHSSAATLASRQLLPFSSLFSFFSSALLILSLCLSSFVSTVLNLLNPSHLFSTLPAFSQFFSQLFSAIAGPNIFPFSAFLSSSQLFSPRPALLFSSHLFSALRSSALFWSKTCFKAGSQCQNPKKVQFYISFQRQMKKNSSAQQRWH
jgi:hypothetical protein